MNAPGGLDLLVQARSALLDALDALREHRGAIVLIGAQAIYLHTGRADIALAEATKDSDLALDMRNLADDPRIEQAMSAAGFSQDMAGGQPGAWLSPSGVPVDLMVPEALAGTPGSQRRGARIPPHSKTATRRAVGLEAAVVDHAPMEVAALAPGDDRRCMVGWLGRFVAISTDDLAAAMLRLIGDPLCGAVSEQAMAYLREMFASGPEALGSVMAGRAEEGIGEPATVAASVALLSADLVAAMPP